MNKFILTILATFALIGLEARNGETYQVDGSGCVSVGASRKATRLELTDHDPRQMQDNSKSWFKW